MRFGVLLGAALLLAAALGAPARGDAAVTGVRTAHAARGRLDVEIGVALERRSVVSVSVACEVAGHPELRTRPYTIRKRVPAGSRTLRVKVDPRRARIRKAAGPVSVALDVTASARGAGTDLGSYAATIPVPMILLPGFGNESAPGGFEAFAAALDLAAGGAYGVGGPNARLTVLPYESFTAPLGAVAADLDRAARKALRGTVFGQVDVVGYSMGGLVARKWVTGPGRGRARNVVFLGTPNEGAPVAFLVGAAARNGTLGTLLEAAGVPELAGLAEGLVSPEAQDAIGLFYPTYPWATVELIPGFPATPAPSVIETLAGVEDTRLDELNQAQPDPGAAYHAVYYSSLPTEFLGVGVGTVDRVDATSLLAGGGLDAASLDDLTALATGDGDGVVPVHSVTMADVPAWAARIVPHDLGAGTHVQYPADPNVWAALLAVLLP